MPNGFNITFGIGSGYLRSEEHTSELQSRFGISYAVFCLKKNFAALHRLVCREPRRDVGCRSDPVTHAARGIRHRHGARDVPPVEATGATHPFSLSPPSAL